MNDPSAAIPRVFEWSDMQRRLAVDAEVTPTELYALFEIAEAAEALIRDEDVRLGDIVQIRLSNAVGRIKWHK